ncbi:hypothetical protein Ae201684P_006710 [Aphanomyces euteiches]|nr:hypothetical protein Ae201684P_006710 [Aphanomyces euteiches]KAH9151121.1 hypothetical protein AeRB84_006197 [Aphanomyces euteiches]
MLGAKTTAPGDGTQSGDEIKGTNSGDISVKKERKTRFAFKTDDDVKVLQEEVDPWRGIAKRLIQQGMDVTARSIRRRVKVIYDAFLSREQQSKKASGIDEDCDEVTQLLTEYHELVVERAICRADDQKVKIKAEKANEAGGMAIRDAAMATVERCRKEEKPELDIHEYLLEQQRHRALELENQTSLKRQRLEHEA